MNREKIYSALREIALSDFADIVEATLSIEGKLRILLKDESYIDIWLSIKREGIYAYHWERKNIDGTIYRYNNIPDKDAKKLKTFPKHFHEKTDDNILENNLSDKPKEAIRTVLEFARKVIKNRKHSKN